MAERDDQAPESSGTSPRRSGHPAPLYGEYLPENPAPGASGPSATAETSRPAGGRDSSTPGQAYPPAPASASAPVSGAEPIPGVPHNLGVVGSGPARSSGTKAATSSGYAPPTGSQSVSDRPAAQQPQIVDASPATGNRGSVDRVITIVLLALGALGALYFAAVLQQLPSSLAILGQALEIDDFVVPQSVHTLGTVGALSILALYALNLIFSIQRLRARKLTFWVPLAAGVIAFILLFAFSTIAISLVPEVTQLLSDPDALSKVLAYLSQQSG